MPNRRFFAGGPELGLKYRYVGFACLLAGLLLAGCSQGWATRPPATVSPSPTALVSLTLAPPTPTPAARVILDAQLPTALPAPLDRYRAWMEEARSLYPYPESIDTMWAVMLCESEGQAGAIAIPYYGLFQYLPETWAGEWNPYRDRPILDAQAQIYATAKAWSEGYQVWWWGCLPP